MDEKRYSLGKVGWYYTKLIIDNETKHELANSVVVKTLNEQQDTIQSLQKDIIEMSDSYQSYIEMESETRSKINDIICTQRKKIFKLEKDNEKLQQLVDVSMKADEVFSVFDDLKYIESALTFLIDNGLEDQCVECEREDIHFVAERLRIVLGSLDDE